MTETVTVTDYSRVGRKGFPIHSAAYPEFEMPTKEVPVDELEGQQPAEPLTPEQKRYLMPPLTPRQFRDALIDADIMPDDVTNAISQIPDEKQRAKALNAWEYPTEFTRTDPLIDQIGAMFNLTPDDIDAMWLGALNENNS